MLQALVVFSLMAVVLIARAALSSAFGVDRAGRLRQRAPPLDLG